MVRSPCNGLKRRKARWQPPKTLPIPTHTLEPFELPDSDLTKELTPPGRPIVNSGINYESTLTRELKISASDVPVMPGSALTDFDGLAFTINKLTAAAINARNRLEWSGETIRALEVALWQKECALARLEGRQTPPELPQVPFFESHTNPEMIVVSKSVVNRGLMGLIGVVAGAFGLYCVGILLFG